MCPPAVPQVAREGTKKTVFTNFMELCKSMNRNHEHVLVGGGGGGGGGAFAVLADAWVARRGRRWGLHTGSGEQRVNGNHEHVLVRGRWVGCHTARRFCGRDALLRSGLGWGGGALLLQMGVLMARLASLPAHPLQQFLLSELGTSGSLDGTQRLIVKGRFLPKAFETVLRRWVGGGYSAQEVASSCILAGWAPSRSACLRHHLLSARRQCKASNRAPLLPPPRSYINDYVLCNSCKSVDTLLDRDSSTRIMFLRCQQCSASRTVSGELPRKREQRDWGAQRPRKAACLGARLVEERAAQLLDPTPPCSPSSVPCTGIKAGFQARTVSRRSQQTG